MPFKLYVDSRFRKDTGGSNSDSEFTVELPHPIQVKGIAFVDTVLVPNSFYVIRAGENDRLHVRETLDNASTYRICTIAQGQYNAITLKDAVLEALQTGKTIPGDYTVTYYVPINKLIIGTLDAAASFHIYPTSWLKANSDTWNTMAFVSMPTPPHPFIDPNNLMDAGSVTGFAGHGTGANILSGNISTDVTAPDVVNTQPYHQLFLRSSLGNGYDAIGPDGSSDICRRIVCQVPLNNIIVDQHGLPHDSVTIGNREISSLSFTLTDCFGKIVNTNGHHISFSIIFLENE
jgi:hypothetical protein